MIALAGFLFFGAAVACLAGLTLVWPGTVLDRVWALNPRAYAELAPLGRSVGIAFLLLAVALAVAGRGWVKRRRWGWQLAAAIISTQIIGDLVNAFRGHWVQGVVGVPIAVAILTYILWPSTRSEFEAR